MQDDLSPFVSVPLTNPAGGWHELYPTGTSYAYHIDSLLRLEMFIC